MSYPIAFCSPLATIPKQEEKSHEAKMSSIIERYKEKVSALPKNPDHNLCKYEGFWYCHGLWHHSKADFSVEATMALQDDLQALPTDVFLTSHPKTGTTWLKALAFAIMNRTKFKISNNGSGPTHPLLTSSPHDCVPFIETESFLHNPSYANGLMATHIPYTSLPKSIIDPDCRIVYICRNPKDVLISFWHFSKKLNDHVSIPTKLDDAFELFSRGMTPCGSFWDHVIGYYKASLERPDKVYFLKYEDLKEDTTNEVKKLAEFLGHAFTKEEESDGTMQEIIKLCDFEKLSEVSKGNKDGKQTSTVLSHDIFFRKGIVGDSINYLTTDMIQILDNITKEKCAGLNLSF